MPALMDLGILAPPIEWNLSMPSTFSRFKPPYAFLLMPVLLSAAAHASSFNCDNAANVSEKAICTDPYTSDLDRKLGALWSSTLPEVADPKALKADQRQWLKQRNQCADNISCLRQQYQMRLVELGHAATPFTWDASWQLIPWGVSTGAELKTQRKDSAHITFEVSAMNGANMGELNGIATLDGTQARYAEGACTLDFKAINGVLDVSQSGDAADCGAGMGVYYAGRYVASEQSLALDNDLLSVGLVRTRQEDDALRKLLKDDYPRLVASSSSRVAGDTSSDLPGAQVTEMWIRGLGSINAAIFASAPDSRFWLLLVVTDQQSHLRTRYYTNAPGWKGRLPESLKRWYDERAKNETLPLDLMP